MRVRATRCLWITCLALGASVPSAAAQSESSLLRPVVHVDDAQDVRGPLNLSRVMFAQQGAEMRLRIRTVTNWRIADLQAAAGRSLCVETLDESLVQRPARLCAGVSRTGRPILQFVTRDDQGRDVVGRPLDADVTRADGRTLDATFLAGAAAIPLGGYHWRVRAQWSDMDGCAGPAACVDHFPDSGQIAATSRLLAVPPCFGAAARDSTLACSNPRLRAAAVPAPDIAVLQPNAFCRVLSEPNLLNACRFGIAPSADHPVTVALLGDSHAAHWRGGLSVVAAAKGWRGISLTRTSCPFSAAVPTLPQPQRDQCVRFRTQALQFLRDNPSITTVFVSNHNGDVVHRRGQDKDTIKIDGYYDALMSIPQSVQRVIVLRDVPANRASSLECVARALRHRRATGRACAVPRTVAVRPDLTVQAARYVESSRVQVLDMTRFLCSQRHCFPVVGGALVHKDVSHLTDTFSTTLGPYLLRGIDALSAESAARAG